MLLRRRRILRGAGYDYTTAGAYFITIVVHQRRRLLADIEADRSLLTDVGRMVLATWRTIPDRHAGAATDAFIVMPDHVHGILWLRPRTSGAAGCGLPEVLQAFKSLTTCAYVDGVHHLGWPRFDRRLWQRSHHDRIIRDEVHLRACRNYIAENPLRWPGDRKFPGTM